MSTTPSPIEQLMQSQDPTPAPSGNSNLSPIEQLMQSQSTAPSNPGAAIQPVTTSTNPKLAVAASGENMPEYVGAAGAAGAGLMGLSAAGSVAGPAAEAVMGHLEEQAAEWAAKYPALMKLLTHAGLPGTIGGAIGYLIHKSK